ncbi:MAG: thioredoxin family protein [Euryarchaeota archaeon]|nr:thioredoxin family protein [Euryarchaeota archaeon]
MLKEIFLVMLIFFAGCAAPKGAGGAEGELNDALHSGKPVLLYFHSDSCPYCKYQMPIVEELKRGYEGRTIVLIIDADKNRDMLRKYGQFGYLPAIVFFNSTAPVAHTYIGLTQKPVLEEKLNGLLK